MPQPHSTILIINSKSPIPILNPNYKSKIFCPNNNPKFQSFIPIPILLPNPECQSPISITSLNSYFRSPILNPNPNLQSQIPISNLKSKPHSNLKPKQNHQSQSSNPILNHDPQSPIPNPNTILPYVPIFSKIYISGISRRESNSSESTYLSGFLKMYVRFFWEETSLLVLLLFC